MERIFIVWGHHIMRNCIKVSQHQEGWEPLLRRWQSQDIEETLLSHCQVEKPCARKEWGQMDCWVTVNKHTLGGNIAAGCICYRTLADIISAPQNISCRCMAIDDWVKFSRKRSFFSRDAQPLWLQLSRLYMQQNRVTTKKTPSHLTSSQEWIGDSRLLEVKYNEDNARDDT